MDRLLRAGIAALAVIAAGLFVFRRRSVVPPEPEGQWHPVDR